jgi:hypothetical protein
MTKVICTGRKECGTDSCLHREAHEKVGAFFDISAACGVWEKCGMFEPMKKVRCTKVKS